MYFMLDNFNNRIKFNLFFEQRLVKEFHKINDSFGGITEVKKQQEKEEILKNTGAELLKLKDQPDIAEIERKYLYNDLLKIRDEFEIQGAMSLELSDKFDVLFMILEKKFSLPVLRSIHQQISDTSNTWFKGAKKEEYAIKFSNDLEIKIIEALGTFDMETCKVFNLMQNKENKLLILKKKETDDFFAYEDDKLEVLSGTENIYQAKVLAKLIEKIGKDNVDKVMGNLNHIQTELHANVIWFLIYSDKIKKADDFILWMEIIEDNLKLVKNLANEAIIILFIRRNIIKKPEDFNNFLIACKDCLDLSNLNRGDVIIIQFFIDALFIKGKIQKIEDLPNLIDGIEDSLRLINNETREFILQLIRSGNISGINELNAWINAVQDNLGTDIKKNHRALVSSMLENGIFTQVDEFKRLNFEKLSLIENELQLDMIKILIDRKILKSVDDFNKLNIDALRIIKNIGFKNLISLLIEKANIKDVGEFNQLLKDLNGNLEIINSIYQFEIINYLIVNGTIKDGKELNNWLQTIKLYSDSVGIKRKISPVWGLISLRFIRKIEDFKKIETEKGKKLLEVLQMVNDVHTPSLAEFLDDPAFDVSKLSLYLYGKGLGALSLGSMDKIVNSWIKSPVKFEFDGKEYTKDIPDELIPSLKLMIVRNLFFQKKEINHANVNQELLRILKMQKKYENIPLFQDRNILFVANDELLTGEYYGHRFAKGKTIDAIKKQGGRLDFLMLQNNLKQEFLQKIANTKPPFTFIFSGHGEEEALIFKNALLKITLEEFVAAYKLRYLRFPELNKQDNNRDILILSCCKSHNFIRNFYDLLPNDMLKPIFISQTEYGEYGYSDFESEYGDRFLEDTFNLASGNVTTLGDVFSGELKQDISSPTCYIPDDSNLLMHLTQRNEEKTQGIVA